MKSLRYINITNYLFTGLVIIALGIFIIIASQDLYFIIINLIGFIFLLRSLSELISMLIKRKSVGREKVVIVVLNILFVIIIATFKNITLSIIPLLFSMYLLLNSIIKIINFILLKSENYYKKYIDLFFGMLFLVFSTVLIFSPLLYLPAVLTFIGVYCILLGFDNIKNFILELIPISKKLKKIRISLPAILEAFLPVQMLNYINTYFNESKDNENVFENNGEYDLEILIHTSNKNENKLGHMDLYFDNKIISYGNYDLSSRILFGGVGDGVLFEANKEKYIQFCIDYSDKTLIGFGLKLTDNELNIIRKEYAKIKSNTYEWNLENLKKKKYNKCYSKLLKKNAEAKFYKFESGEFKKYFICGSNCTKFAERILSGSTNILKLVGVITPGTYLNYLEQEYHKKSSNVVYRKIYR